MAQISQRIDRLGIELADVLEGHWLQTGLDAVTYVWASFEAEVLRTTRGQRQ